LYPSGTFPGEAEKRKQKNQGGKISFILLCFYKYAVCFIFRSVKSQTKICATFRPCYFNIQPCFWVWAWCRIKLHVQ